MARSLDDLIGDDIIDSRELIERRDELQALFDVETELEDGSLEGPFSTEDADELRRLNELCEEGEDNFADWPYGVGLIRDSYFEEYARELAKDIGAIQDDAGWPNSYIDWKAAAEALQMDYTTIEIGGCDYHGR